MTTEDRTYIPAAGRHWRLPFYDLMASLLGGDRVRATFVQQSALGSTDRILEIGCGTGSLMLVIKRAYPNADVVGLDPDPRALEMARRKAERAGVRVRFDRGFSDALPYPDASFDRVMSSFMLHHLGSRDKQLTMREAMRVLRPGGHLDVIDFAHSPSPGRGILGHLARSRSRTGGTGDHAVIELMKTTGFRDARVANHLPMRLGTAACYRATRPG